MKYLFFRVIFLFCFVCNFSVHAEELPSVIENGFVAYKSKGPKEAIEAWAKGGAMEGSKEALSQANMFRQIEDYYGEYLGYDLFKVNSLGPKTSVYLITLNYKKGVLFAKYFTYKAKSDDEIISGFKFHTEADTIWPAYIIYGR